MKMAADPKQFMEDVFYFALQSHVGLKPTVLMYSVQKRTNLTVGT